MARSIRDEGRVASAWVMSIVGHFVAAGLGGFVLASSLSTRPPVSLVVPAAVLSIDTVEIELPPFVDEGLAAVASAQMPVAPLPRGGGEDMPRPDTHERGRGGADTSLEPALNLADRDDGMILSPGILNRIDRSQLQRIRSSSHRRSQEDWRASREPMQLTFLAQGRSGTRHERRVPAERDPSAGARESGAPRRSGGVLGATELPTGGVERHRTPGGAVEGAAHASAGVGVRDGIAGNDHRDSAAVPHARPDVAESAPSVPSNARGKPSDTVDSEQEEATAVQSILHSSTAGGARGAGLGGQAGPGTSGSGGVTGQGSAARALGTSSGPGLDNDPRDSHRSLYISHAVAKVRSLWSPNTFPRSALADGLQGVAIVTFTILPDGSVASVAVTRPSGVPEYDENCRRLVLRAAPFGPMPPEMGQSFRLAIPMDARNPAVAHRTTRVD